MNREYIETHELEPIITQGINHVVKQQLQDPFSYLTSYFAQKAKQALKVMEIKAIQVLSNEGLPQIKVLKFHILFITLKQLIFTVSYQQQTLHFSSPITTNVLNHDTKLIYDEDNSIFQGKGMSQACKIINDEINKIIKSQSVSLDQDLYQYYTENPTHLPLIYPISFGAQWVNETVQQQKDKEITENNKNNENNEEQKPQTAKYFFNLLQGSKLVNSKSKVIYKIYVLGDWQQVEPNVAHVRKTIVSGKQGEAALKYGPDGTFICSVDSIADNLKMVDATSIGISWQADLFYNPDKKNYELDNPKQPLDTDAMIEYLFKLSNEKQSINYYEDALQSEDIAGWQKLMKRFSGTNVKIGSKKLFQTLEQAQKLVEDGLIIDIVHLQPYESVTYERFINLVEYLKSKQIHILIGDTFTKTDDTYLVRLSSSISNSSLVLTPPLKFENILKLNE